eukprot:12251746-Karenia_brevis.AAC.1
MSELTEECSSWKCCMLKFTTFFVAVLLIVPPPPGCPTTTHTKILHQTPPPDFDLSVVHSWDSKDWSSLASAAKEEPEVISDDDPEPTTA